MKLESMTKKQLIEKIRLDENRNNLVSAQRALDYRELNTLCIAQRNAIESGTEAQFLQAKLESLELKTDLKIAELTETIAEIEKEKRDLEKDVDSRDSQIHELESELEEMKSFDIREMSLAEIATFKTDSLSEAMDLENSLLALELAQ